MSKRDLFKKRSTVRPSEYPEFDKFKDAIRHAYWIHPEFSYTSDVQDWSQNISDKERNVLKKSLMMVAQMEVAVEDFWGGLHKRLPKPEVAAIGSTFAESEVRHQDAYVHLLEIMGLNGKFDKLEEDYPVIQERVKMLEAHLSGRDLKTDKEYVQSLLFFSLFIENVFLFSQFVIIMSFNKHKKLFKGISNVVEATSKEEQIHSLFGKELINILQKEHPEWFGPDQLAYMVDFCKEIIDSELKTIDWIFEEGDLEFLTKKDVEVFIKDRMNDSLKGIGLEEAYELDDKELERTEWFDDELSVTKHTDFFDKRSTNYSKRAVSVTSDDLF